MLNAFRESEAPLTDVQYLHLRYKEQITESTAIVVAAQTIHDTLAKRETLADDLKEVKYDLDEYIVRRLWWPI